MRLHLAAVVQEVAIAKLVPLKLLTETMEVVQRQGSVKVRSAIIKKIPHSDRPTGLRRAHSEGMDGHRTAAVGPPEVQCVSSALHIHLPWLTLISRRDYHPPSLSRRPRRGRAVRAALFYSVA